MEFSQVYYNVYIIILFPTALKCPTCCQMHRVSPSLRANGFPKNFTLANIVDVLKTHATHTPDLQSTSQNLYIETVDLQACRDTEKNKHGEADCQADEATRLVGFPGFYNVSSDEAATLFKLVINTDGYYLLRPSSDPKAFCTISVSNQGKIISYKIMSLVTEERVQLIFFEPSLKFASIASMVDHYKQYPLNEYINTRLVHHIEPLEKHQDKLSLKNDAASSDLLGTSHYSKETPLKKGNKTQLTVSSAEPTPLSPSCSSIDQKVQQGVLSSNADREVITSLPGFHNDLPKENIPIVLASATLKDFSYLVRPSTSNMGELVISITAQKQILNLRVLRDTSNGMYYAASNRKFSTLKELLEFHRVVPLISHELGGKKMYLLHPVTATEIHKALKQQKKSKFKFF